MFVFPESFIVLEYLGLWPSTKYNSGWKQKLYNCYTLLVVLLMITFCVSGGIELFIFTHNIDEFVNNGFMQLTVTTVCLKLFVFIVKRSDIRKLLESVQAELCQAKNEEEQDILHEWDARTSIFIQGYHFLVLCAMTFTLVGVIKNNIPSKTLPFNGWFPFNRTESIGYWTAVLHQVIAHIATAAINTTVDIAIYGIMLQTCAQLNILKCRLRKILEVLEHDIPSSNNKRDIHEIDDAVDEDYKLNNTKEGGRKIIQNCIKHHLLIVQFAETCNTIFANIIFLQFFASGLILCISAQLLTKLKFMSSEYLFLVSYLGCMLSQIFMYCWYGNEVILQSSNIDMAVYEMGWMKVSTDMQKDLMIIMVRSVRPIQFTSGHMVTLSVKSFNSLMKTSYSVYNLLSQAA